jgi:pilus assembly protein FimV
VQKTPKQNRLKVIALAATLAFSPTLANAAGLGRITVLSALGQPLKAELEITANKDELSSLSARLASAEAFRIAGIEYVTALTSVHFSRDIKERNGKRFLEITSDRPVNEPFIDMLIELNWSSGRLVREYTFLLDPPDLAQKAAPVPVTTPAIRAAAPEPESATERPAPTAANRPARAVMETDAPLKAAPTLRRAAPERTSETATDEASSRKINSGDTLGKIAQETRPDGVSLDQMLLALFRSNSDAFDGNMNRMRAGRILKIPDANAVRAIDAVDAHREVVAQAADFNAYRRKLAELASSAPASSEPGSRVAAGKITPKVVDKTPLAEAGKDKLEVSRTETAAVKPDTKGAGKQTPVQGRLSALEEDLVSRERALNEAGSRIAQLEKNLVDLKKLAEMKSEAGAAMQKQAEAAKPPVASPPPPAPAAPPTPSVAAAPATPPVAATPATPVAEPAQPKPAAEPATPAVESAKPPPAPPKKKILPPPEPVPEPDFLDENAPLVFGGSGVLALLLGYLGFAAYRRKKQQVPEEVAPLSQADLSTNSVFSDAASESVNVTAAAPGEFSISDSTMDSSAEVVDPLVEADTYLAFGRDAQAEEILLDALQKEPTRHAIHLKLLEIYSARRSPMQFNTLARELHDQTGGQGGDWDRAQGMGHALDPNNPLYQATEQLPVGNNSPTDQLSSVAEIAALGTVASVAAVAVTQEAQPRPHAVDPDATMVFAAPVNIETLPAAAESVPVVADDIASLDFDLDLGETPATAVDVAPAELSVKASVDSGLDFDLDLDEPQSTADAKASAETASSDIAALDIDFDLNLPDVAVAPAASQDSNTIAFDLDLPTESHASALDIDVAAPAAETATALANDVPALPDVADTNEIDFALDLELPEVSQATETTLGAVALEPDAVVLATTDPLDTPKADEAASIDFDFDLDLGDSTPPIDVVDVADGTTTMDAEGVTELPEPQSFAPPLDLASINLELDSPELAPAPESVEGGGVVEDVVPDNPESATKLELALAYEEMGDSDGARELLEEVLKEGSPGQRAAAQAKLDTLG